MAEQVKQSLKIDVRAAVNAVQIYFQSIQDLIGSEPRNVRLEEVELSEDKKFWLITLGYNLSNFVKNNPLETLGISIGENREYKIFKVDAETGEVASMKIREL